MIMLTSINHSLNRSVVIFLLIGISFKTFSQSGTWTWMKGSDTTDASGIFGIQTIADTNNTPPALYGPSAWTDHDGNFWIFGGWQNDSLNGKCNNDLWKYEPSINMWTWMKGP